MTISNLQLGSESDYLSYFIENFCNRLLYTKDGIRVFFRKNHFYHAFFETVNVNKDTFSLDRARRMPDILPTLQSPFSDYRCGWDSKKKKHIATKRVAILKDSFVVVILLKQNKRTGHLQGEFITCYTATNWTHQRILTNPIWDISMLNDKKYR